MKRIFLFLLTNIAVMVVLSVVVRLLGLDRALAANGLDVGALLVFSAVVGFTGAIISLLMSKPMAKWSTGAQVIETPKNENEAWLVATVKRLADKAGVGMTLRIVSDQDSAIRGTLASALVALARPKLTPGDLSRRVPTRWCDNHARENATSTAKSQPDHRYRRHAIRSATPMRLSIQTSSR